MKTLLACLAAIALAFPVPAQKVLEPGTPKTGYIKFVSRSQLATLHAHVALPKGYADDRNRDVRYGVIYLLHGAGGDYRAWPTIAKLQFLADTHNRLIVSPSAGLFSWYVDSDTNKRNRGETIIIKEVLPLIDAKYRTRAKENDRWITGFSMGGYGALRLGLKYPQLFTAVGGLSPCITPSKWGNSWHLNDAMQSMAKRGTRYDLFNAEMVKQTAGGKGRVLSILCGKQDFFYPENLAAHKALKQAGVTHQWQDLNGSHDTRFWRRSLVLQLGYFSKHAKELETRPELKHSKQSAK